MPAEQYLYLTTVGRRTGQPREIEIWFTESDGHFYVIAEHTTSNWVQNIRAQPAVSVRVAGRSFSGNTRLLDEKRDADLIAVVQSLSRAKYGWGEGQIVELAPVQAEVEKTGAGQEVEKGKQLGGRSESLVDVASARKS